MQVRLPALALLAVTSLSCLAQAVPAGQIETLTGRKLTLPDAIRGQIVIFLVGFSRSSSKPVSEWNKNLRPIFAGDQNVRIYQAADIAGAPHIFQGMIISGMRKGQPPDQRDNFFVVTENDNAWKQWVGFSAPDDAYIVLVDKSGQQVWKTHGAFNQTLLADLKTRALALEAQ